MTKYFTISAALLVMVIIALYFATEERRETVEQLNRFVAAGNSSTPYNIDEYTRMDSVTSEQMALVFNITIVDGAHEYESASKEQEILAWFKSSVCNVPEFQEKLLKKGIAIMYRYSSLSGVFLGEHRYTREHCSNA